MKKYLISFGDDLLYKYQKLRLKKEAEDSGWFDDIIIHSPKTINQFLEKHKEFVDKSPGYGCWIWKPYIILDQLNKIDHGDCLVYMDAGGSVLSHKKNRFEEYIRMLNESDRPIIAFYDGGDHNGPPKYKEVLFQKARVLKRFNLYDNKDFLNSGHIEAGIIVFKKCDFTIEFVQEWLDLLLENDYSLVNDEDDNEQLEEFMVHRHDQSILSVLSKLNNTIMLGLSECYGSGPFFSNRWTDKGAKDKAPDIFRKEPEYSEYKHYNWDLYLHDPLVRDNTINMVKDLFKLIHGNLIFDKNLKIQFLNLVIEKLDQIQFGKGLFRIKLKINETSYFEADNQEKITGEFGCEFIIDDPHYFNFRITETDVEFFQNAEWEKRLYVSEYSRTWDCNYK